MYEDLGFQSALLRADSTNAFFLEGHQCLAVRSLRGSGPRKYFASPRRPIAEQVLCLWATFPGSPSQPLALTEPEYSLADLMALTGYG